MDEGWAQLVSTSDLESDPVLVTKDKFIIGRFKTGTDLSLSDNRLVSGVHCVIERDSNGGVWIEDKSTNGTLVNVTEKLHHQKVQLKHGDEIYIVYKTNEPQQNVSYLFQELDKLKQEEEDTSWESTHSDLEATLEATLPYADDGLEEDAGDSSVAGDRKRHLQECILGGQTDRQEPALKRPCQLSPARNPGMTENRSSDNEPGTSGAHTDLDTEPGADSTQDVAPSSGDGETPGGKLVNCAASDSPELLHTENSVDTESRGTAEERGEKDSVPGGSTSGVSGDCQMSEKKRKCEKDDFEESLTCAICQEILHDCISLQPCMHAYCSGCYSEWMVRSDQCPSCRMKVDRFNKNHIVNNLVDAYLKEHPEKRRPKEDLEELDAKNKITKNLQWPPGMRLHGSSDDTDDSGDTGSDTDDDTGGFCSPQTVFGPPRTVCRQCPDYAPPGGACAAMADVLSSTSDATMTPTVTFQCHPTQTHIMCRCCMQPMPDRRPGDGQIDTSPPSPQKCTLCGNAFCHLYWGCSRSGCRGCLAKFRDMNFAESCLSTIILNNEYESNVLKGHMQTKNMTIKDLLTQCCHKLETGEFPQTGSVTPDMVVCYRCALAGLQSLAYLFRKAIPSDQLPAPVTSRPDCYWGRHCRTQHNKPPHAARYNHICEQTRRT